MIRLEGSTRRILETLLRADSPSGMRLGEVAKKVRLAHTTVLAHLRALAAEGWLETLEVAQHDEEGRPVGVPYTAYRAPQATSIQWLDRNRRILERWTTSVPMDWRFPLVSRVRDPQAQTFLYEWLDRAQARALLPDPCSHHEAQSPKPPLLQVVVYGSCARGDARATSDIDILLLGNQRWRAAGRLTDLAHEISLRGGRKPDLRSMTIMEFAATGEAFRESVKKEGKTVFCNDSDAAWVEGPHG